MKNRLFIILPAVVIVAACNFLDTYPQDVKTVDASYETVADVQEALTGVYTTLAASQLYGNNMLGRMGLSADIGYEYYSSDANTVGYYEVVASDAKINSYWHYLYQGIGNANRLLENMDKAPLESSEAVRIRSEARFLRAYYHFMLTVRFGDIPYVDRVPASGSAQDVQLSQTPRDQVYAKIIADMEEAAGGLPDASSLTGGGRLSKSAAWGIIARVCLNAAGYPCYMPGMYAKARENAKKVIDSGFHALNPSYEQVFINYMQDLYDIQESIWEVEFYGNGTGTYTTVSGMVGRNNGIGFSNSSGLRDDIGVSIGTTRATSYYYGLFEEGDLRRDWTIAPYTYSSSGEKVEQPTNIWIRFCGKFRREYETLLPKSVSFTPTNFPLLRYSDVLLMYAESVACDPASTSEDITLAYGYLNQVRRRGYGKDVAVADASVDVPVEGAAALLETIKDERARELGYELLRKDDIVRWGEFYTRMKHVGSLIPGAYTSSYYVAGRQYYGNVRSRDVLWPIPSYEMGVNRNLVQNSGW